MRWLLNLFRPFEPPTDKQRRFAGYLGITVTPRMSKQDVSAAIDRKKAEDPRGYGKACGQIGAANRKAATISDAVFYHGPQASDMHDSSPLDEAWLKSPEGREHAKLLKKWTRVSADDPYGIFVYRDPDSRRVEVDVARVAAADVDHVADRGIQVILDVSLPEQTRDSQTGWKILEWNRDLGWFPVSDVLLWHKLPASFADVEGCVLDRNASGDDRRQYKRYQSAIEKGRKLAKEQGLL